jgi:hypothetical protein
MTPPQIINRREQWLVDILLCVLEMAGKKHPGKPGTGEGRAHGDRRERFGRL